MLPSRKRGIIHEEQCKLYFLSLGYDISVPIGECSPYDFILDIGCKLLKVQCKKSIFRNGALVFEAYTTKPNKYRGALEVVRYNLLDVDYFATFYNDICYLFPNSLNLPVDILLRIDYPKTKSSIDKIRWAIEYEGSYIINRLIDPDNTPIRSGLQDFETFMNHDNNDSPKNFRWITNGIETKRFYGDKIPEGFYIGRTGKVNQFT